MNKSIRIVLTCLIHILISQGLHAASAAYSNDISDMRSFGNASAVTARADSPATNWYNPAGLVRLQGTQMSATLASENVYFEFDSVTGRTVEAEPGHYHIPSLFFTHTPNNRWAFGFGINAAYGLTTEWDDPLTDYISTRAEFKPVNFNPNLAYALNDSFSIAIGLDVHYADGTIKKNINQTLLNSYLYGTATGMSALVVSPDALSSLEGDDTAVGANFALLYSPTENIQMGLSYRSKVDFDLEGDTTLEGLTGLSALTFGSASYEVDAKLGIAIPATWTLGVAVKPTESTTLELDVEYAEWSVIDEFRIEYDGETDPVRLAILNMGNPIDKDWDEPGTSPSVSKNVSLPTSRCFAEPVTARRRSRKKRRTPCSRVSIITVSTADSKSPSVIPASPSPWITRTANRTM
jgi:long-chain fatty acid transport protein